MLNALEMKAKLEELKAEAQVFLDSNEIEKAEAKTLEVKILNAQVEIQEKLDNARNQIEGMQNQVTSKDEEINNLTASLEVMKQEKEELMNKFTESTDKVTTLNEQVNAMKPIVEDYNQKQYEDQLNKAKEEYKAKFEKVNGLEAFKSEEIQNLIKGTINKDSSVSKKAKFDLSEKIMEMFDNQDMNDISVANIQENAVETKDLNQEVNEFEKVYGFKRQ